MEEKLGGSRITRIIKRVEFFTFFLNVDYIFIYYILILHHASVKVIIIGK